MSVRRRVWHLIAAYGHLWTRPGNSSVRRTVRESRRVVKESFTTAPDLTPAQLERARAAMDAIHGDSGLLGRRL